MVRNSRVFILTAALVVLSAVASLALGQYVIAPATIVRYLVAGPGTEGIAASVIWDIRLPRIVLGLAVGAALGMAGALMQAVFANPLAEPSVIGVTTGAGVGAAVAIVANLSFAGAFTVPMLAFLAAVLVTAIIYRSARANGRVVVVNLILTGIAINAVCGAIISLLVYLAPTTNREKIVFWQMGSLAGAQWNHVAVVLPVVIVGTAGAMTLGRQLNLLALGERAAGHSGINVARLRILAIVAAAVLTAAAVAFAGLIGFVGLIVPHVMRTVMGPDNVALLPASALAGAGVIAAADVAARTVIPFGDLPIGIFTAVVGGPTFFVLLRRMMRRGVH